MLKMLEKLFVYGTLGPGRPNAHILENIGGSWQDGTVKGTLLRKGWGAAMGYLGITLDENGDTVEGFVFCSENLKDHWGKLDQFEGEAYQRVLTKVKLSNDTFIKAFIYTLKE